MAHTLQGYHASPQAHGCTTPWRDRVLDFEGLNGAVGTPDVLAAGRRYEGG